MKASDTRHLGRAGIDLTVLGLGTAPLGGLYAPVAADDARAALAAAWEAGIRYYDTAPMYGLGRAEHFVGTMLRDRGETGETFRISTKVGRLMATERPGRPLPPEAPKNEFDSGWFNGLPFREVFDYSYDAIMRSYDDSLQRTGLGRLDLLFVHDIGRVTHGALHDHHWSALTRGGGFKALTELRSAGLIAGFGLGVNEWQAIRDAMEEADLDCSMLAGRHSLLDHEAAAEFLPLAKRRGVDLVIAGVFNSGILASSGTRRKFNYVDAPAEVVARVERLRDICQAFDVPLPAAAIQYPLRHPAATCIVVGAKTAAQVRQNIAWFEQPIPAELWSALAEAGLIPATVTTERP